MGRGVESGAPEQKLAELEALVLELREKLRARDELLSIASHELRTPLNALHLVTDLLREQDRERSPDSVASIAKRIRNQVERLNGIVEQLLEVSRLNEDRAALEYAPADLRELAREAARRAEEDARESGCELDCDGGAAPGRYDRARVEQILGNLLANAFHSGAGEPVELRVEPAGDRVLVSVRDGGVGIPEREQPRLFRRFELWVVRELARRMGGEVRVRSAPGEGCRIEVELPRRLEESAAEPRA